MKPQYRVEAVDKHQGLKYSGPFSNSVQTALESITPNKNGQRPAQYRLVKYYEREVGGVMFCERDMSTPSIYAKTLKELEELTE